MTLINLMKNSNKLKSNSEFQDFHKLCSKKCDVLVCVVICLLGVGGAQAGASAS